MLRCRLALGQNAGIAAHPWVVQSRPRMHFTMNREKPKADTRLIPRREPRLPPGQVRTEKWPVLHYGSVPKVDLETWDLRIHGMVERPQRWTWTEFKALPRVGVQSDINCVTRWSRFDNQWEGVA